MIVPWGFKGVKAVETTTALRGEFNNKGAVMLIDAARLSSWLRCGVGCYVSNMSKVPFLASLVVDDSPMFHFSIPVGQQLEVESWFTSSASPWYIQASKLAGVTMLAGHQPPNKSKWSIFMVAGVYPQGSLWQVILQKWSGNVIWR